MTLNVLRWPQADKAPPHSLLVLCHGVGADASQMELFVQHLRPLMPGTAFLAPDGSLPFDGAPFGRQWFSLRDRTPAILEAGAEAATPLLNQAIDSECARLGLVSGRVVLAGFSQGAMMALHAGLRRHPAPAAILAYSGALLDTPALARDLSGRPPVLLVHGEQDMVVPFGLGPTAERTLHRLGVPVETCWRPALGHWVDEEGIHAGLAFLSRILAL